MKFLAHWLFEVRGRRSPCSSSCRSRFLHRDRAVDLIGLFRCRFLMQNDTMIYIKDLSDRVGGFGHLLFFGQGGFLSHQDAVANITLFGKEVMPRLRELNPEPRKAAAAD